MEILVKNTSDDAKAVSTYNVLMSISKHLSSRDDCKGEVYRVAIGMLDDNQHICKSWPKDWSSNTSIFFETPVYVFPNTHKRQVTDKMPIIQHIIIDHFPEIFGGAANGCQCQIKPNKLVTGIYEYKLSNNNKSRRWFRVV